MEIPASRPPAPDRPDTALTSAQFHILLTLVQGQLHGYAIMQEIERRTDGAVELGPATLYRSIKQLLSRALIREVDTVGDGGLDGHKQRRSYALTAEGRAHAVQEARRLKALVRWAEEDMVLEGGGS